MWTLNESTIWSFGEVGGLSIAAERVEWHAGLFCSLSPRHITSSSFRLAPKFKLRARQRRKCTVFVGYVLPIGIYARWHYFVKEPR